MDSVDSELASRRNGHLITVLHAATLRAFKNAGRLFSRSRQSYGPSHAFESIKEENPSRQIPISSEAISDGRVNRAGQWIRRPRSTTNPGSDSGFDNSVCNQKYTPVTFFPNVLYHQFKMFYNMFFLSVALSQLVPALRVGFFWAYFGPLVFVLAVSITKEAVDDIARFRRDKNMNMFAYTLLVQSQQGDVEDLESGRVFSIFGSSRRTISPSTDRVGVESVRIASRDIRVGDILLLETNERVPADCVLLRASANSANAHESHAAGRTASDSAGSIFIRTDQLDGETDWKLRRAVCLTQEMESDDNLLRSGGTLEIEHPRKEIYDFNGVFHLPPPLHDVPRVDDEQSRSWKTNVECQEAASHLSRSGQSPPLDLKESITLENTLWANTVVASGRAICVVVYVGKETRCMLNASAPRTKVGKLELEINRISKMLFSLLFSLSATLTILRGLAGQWLLYFFRYFLLLSAIIPISMRVNLDMAKIVYSIFMEGDPLRMPGCTVRNSNIPEELGRVEYLLSDKTGTLTQNEMGFKKLHLGNILFGRDSVEDIRAYILKACSELSRGTYLASQVPSSQHSSSYERNNATTASSSPDEIVVQPTDLFDSRASLQSPPLQARRIHFQVLDSILAVGITHNVTPVEECGQRSYQAASPDEVALVKFAESVGVILLERTTSHVTLALPDSVRIKFEIIAEFPFTSEAKRMGIIVRNTSTNVVTFFSKGADSVMSEMVQYNDWLEEECGNLAREGLRTLVFAKRELSHDELNDFLGKWSAARTAQSRRKESMNMIQSTLEHNLRLLALTGVEDKLQANVRETLEKLRHAGIRIWMLTGDKVETATCIAVSSRLAERSHGIYYITGVKSQNDALRALSRFRGQAGSEVLVIDGTSLQIFLDLFPAEFIDAAAMAPAAVACRCSPTQKADLARLLQEHKQARVAAIGDGGNDVSMIQQANVGVGIPGKEGMQASLAADISVTSFSQLTRLLLWHGRNSYKRSARLAQFVMHRGLIISIIQTVYCALFFYAAVSVYSAWILVGYATLFTMFPVFSLILDEDVSEAAAETYPELYMDLRKGRSLNLKTFLSWVFKSIYQGTMIMVFSVYVLWDDEYFTTLHLSAISFTSLILTELLMVAAEVHVWHWMMMAAEACSIGFYLLAIAVLEDTFDHSMMLTLGFLGRVFAVTLVSCVPVTLGKWIKRKIAPAPYSKLQTE